MTNQQALQQYADTQDAHAFRILVDQYQRLVYSAASRRLARVEDIEDVVQLTFLKLAKTARQIHRDLSSWLYTTAINTANDLIRRDQTRRRHETLAAPAESFTHDTDREDWNQLSLFIDEALLELSPSDRSLIVEYFLRARTQRDLAENLNVSQPTILRRIHAAVEQLRHRLANRGYSSTAPLLVMLSNIPQPNIPPAITAELAKIGISGLSTNTIHFAHSIGWVKVAFAALTVLALLTGAMILLPKTPAANPPIPIAAAPASQPIAAPPDPNYWRTAFTTAYALKPSENLRFIPPPPLPERQTYLLKTENNDAPMPFIQWRWINNSLKRQMMISAGPNGADLGSVLWTCLKIDGHEVALNNIPHLNLDGDWIVRDSASTEQILADLHTILLNQFKTDINYKKDEITKDAMVATGRYRLHRIDGTTGGLQIYTDTLDHPKPGDSIQGGGSSAPPEFWNMLSGYLQIPFVDQTKNEPREIDWFLSRSIAAANTSAGRQLILDNITKQTGVSFKQEKHTFTTWIFSAPNLPATSPAQPVGN